MLANNSSNRLFLAYLQEKGPTLCLTEGAFHLRSMYTPRRSKAQLNVIEFLYCFCGHVDKDDGERRKGV